MFHKTGPFVCTLHNNPIPQQMVQMIFCDLSHTFHKQIPMFPSMFCHPTLGNFDTSFNNDYHHPLVLLSAQLCVAINKCNANPCLQGRCERDSDTSFRCICDTGFVGALCQHDTDACQRDPCLNDAECTDGIGNFSCACKPGYQGQFDN